MSDTAERIAVIRDYVPRLEALVAGLSIEQLTTPYNAPEWTIAQNIHHLVDSHMTSYLRFKRMIVEDNPTVRGYNQDAFAGLPDAKDAHITDSLMILRGLHARWARMLNNIEDWSRTCYHDEAQKTISLDDMLNAYVRHCNAHIQQIQEVLDKMPRDAS